MNTIRALNGLFQKVPIWVVCLILVSPAVYLTYALFNNQLGPDPIRTYERSIGELGFKLILFILLITPLKDLANINLIKFRRVFGVIAFIYICLHFLSYLVLDLGLNTNELWKDILKRPYITFGMVSAVMMLFLTITSNNLSIRKLGLRNWKHLHKLVYVIAIGASLHYLLLTKTWQIEPIIYSVLVMVLLFYRIISFRS